MKRLDKFKKVSLGMLTIVMTFSLFTACEDEPPTNYIPKTYVEAYLIVGEPIQSIKIFHTQPWNEQYSMEKALIDNATVSIIPSDGDPIELSYSDVDPVGYFNDDTDYLVLGEMEYHLEISIPDEDLITGTTYTPPAFDWTVPPVDTLYFPEDTAKVYKYDMEQFFWEYNKDYFYMVAISCKDTLNYGSMLQPPNENDKNRRTPADEYEDDAGTEVTTYNFMMIESWEAFKWFGKQEISVYCADYNFLKWFFQSFSGTYYEPNASSVEGAIGVFASAAVVRKDVFLKKPSVYYE